MRFYINPHRLSPPRPFIMPHVLLNFSWKRWLDKGWSRHAIIDSAVEKIFLFGKQQEYPPQYWIRFQKVLAKARNDSRVWVVIPDYPDDYVAGLTYEGGLDNVDKTFRNIRKWIDYPDITWLPVIQSRYLDRQRFVEACKIMREEFNPPRLGIGTVCKTNNLPFIRFCLETARQYFPNAWIHAFGLTLRALPHARHYIDSCDSSSHIVWLRWEHRDRGWSPTDPRLADKAADAWLKRAQEIVSQPCLEAGRR